MAVPTLVQASAGTVITATSGIVSLTGCTAGNVIITQEFFDGTGANFVPDTITNIENLVGDPSGLTHINTPSGVLNVGSPTAGQGVLHIGRVTVNGTVSFNCRPNSGNDAYVRIYEFSGVSTGTTLATVIENGSAGVAVDAQATSATVSDVGVTTLGPDRLACNFIFVGDDNQLELTAMTGETGGDWVYPVAAFGSATGTDGAIALVTADMPSAGTINGGSDTMTSDPWGIRGFALIGTTGGAPPDNLNIRLYRRTKRNLSRIAVQNAY